MAGEGRQVERLRATPMLITATAVLIAAVVLFAVNLTEQRTGVVWGWLPAVLSTAVAGLICGQAARMPGPDPAARRLWRQLTLVSVLIVLGQVGDTLHTLREPAWTLRQAYDGFSATCYALAMVVLVWALLRLPTSPEGTRRQMLRFAMDAATVSITMGIFVWYLAAGAGLAAPGERTTPTFVLILLGSLGLMAALALVKVAVSGLGGLDRVAARLLAAGCTLGAVAGGLMPIVVDLRAGMSESQVVVPTAMLCLALAADRQRRVAGLPGPDVRRRPISLVPYLAVAATDALLIVVARQVGGMVLTVAVAAVCLTGLVVARQVSALSENGRLLRRVHVGQAELAHRASHDDLTALANRSLFEQCTSEALAHAGPDPVSLALIDLDDFKAINDRLGHPVGDALLVVVGQRLRECVRAGDVVARLGGDEFGLLLPGLPGGEATDVLARVGDALSRPVHALGHDLLVRASIGLAEAWPGAVPEELLRRADLAMYAAKERGKGRYAVYDAALEQHQAADAQLGAELRQALDRGEFSLVYQPIVRLPDGRWTGMETLVRWSSPERGPVGPDTFIPVAERTGLIVPLGGWILRTALRQAADWSQRYGADAPREIAINVSARQLREPGFADDVRDALADTGVDPERVVVEVTETAVFDGGVALDTLQDLVGLGVKVALDDFGTGHSSLGLLRTCPVDTLKVDKSFVDGIGGRSEEAVIATAMIGITDGLHLQAVAEGVETAEQADTLYRLGYRFAQGYHFSRPLTPEQVGEKLDAVRGVPV